MNEQLFGLKIRNKLNAGSAKLSPEVTDRLFQARQAALARHAQLARGWSLASVGVRILSSWDQYGRPLMLSVLLMAAIFTANDVVKQQRASELAEIDSALLADDLPISAYLDRGFDTWLQSSGQY